MDPKEVLAPNTKHIQAPKIVNIAPVYRLSYIRGIYYEGIGAV